MLADSVRTPPHVARAAMRNTILLGGVRAGWRRLRRPLLYIDATGRHTAKSLREVLPQAELARVVGSGHWAQLEVPDQINAMLRRFIELH